MCGVYYLSGLVGMVCLAIIGMLNMGCYNWFGVRPLGQQTICQLKRWGNCKIGQICTGHTQLMIFLREGRVPPLPSSKT